MAIKTYKYTYCLDSATKTEPAVGATDTETQSDFDKHLKESEVMMLSLTAIKVAVG